MSDSEDANERLKEAFAAAKRGDHAEAVRLFESSLPNLPDAPKTAWRWNYFGWECAKLQRFDDAITAFRRAIEFNPGYVWPYHGWGSVLEHMGKLSEAVEMHRKGIAVKPRAGGFIYLGCCQSRLGRDSEAEASYREALRLDPENEEAMNNLASKTAAPEETTALLERAIEIDPKYAIAKRNLAAHVVRQDRDRALRLLREAVIDDPKCVEAHVLLGLHLMGTPEFVEAENHLRRAIELEDDCANAQLYLAQLLDYHRPDADPEPYYRRACEFDPECSFARQVYGRFCCRNERFDDAERLLREAVRLDPTDARAAYRLGEMFSERGGKKDLRKAVSWLKKSTKLDPTDAATHTELAITLDCMSRDEDAEEEFRRACRLAPQRCRPFSCYGRFCESRSRRKTAALLYRAALRRDPSRDFAMFRLAICLVEIGDWAAAQVWLARFCELDIEDERTTQARTLLRTLGSQSKGAKTGGDCRRDH